MTANRRFCESKSKMCTKPCIANSGSWPCIAHAVIALNFRWRYERRYMRRELNAAAAAATLGVGRCVSSMSATIRSSIQFRSTCRYFTRWLSAFVRKVMLSMSIGLKTSASRGCSITILRNVEYRGEDYISICCSLASARASVEVITWGI